MADIPETRYAKSGDTHIAYQVIGSGPLDVVWVPGFVSHVEAQWQNPAGMFGSVSKLGTWITVRSMTQRPAMTSRVGRRLPCRYCSEPGRPPRAAATCINSPSKRYTATLHGLNSFMALS